MPTGASVLRTLLPLVRRQHGALSGRQLAAAGASPAAVKQLVATGALVRVARSTYVVPGASSTDRQRLWVALLDHAGSPPAEARVVVARRSAAGVHRLPGFDERDVDLLAHECRSRGGSDERRSLCTLRATSWLPAEHVTTVDSLPVTSVARTIFDLAGLSSDRRLRSGRAYVHPKRVERTLDTALARGLDLRLVVNVVATLGKRGRPGTTLMRELLDDRRGAYVPTESELEDLVLAVLAAHGVPLPERQVVLGDSVGIVGRVDFYYRPERLVIEADSRVHHTVMLDWRNDRARDARLAAMGVRVIRVTWRDLTERPDAFAATVMRALRASSAA